MRLDPKLEKKLKNKVLSLLEKGRSGFDIMHTLASVDYMKDLLKHEKGDEKILVTTMYLHDIGYADLVKKNYKYKDLKPIKPLHMEIGAKKAREILKEISGYTQDEIDQVANLVLTHDKKKSGKNYDETIVFEADSLAIADLDKFHTHWTRQEQRDYYKNSFMVERMPLFKTKTGKDMLKKMLAKTMDTLNKQ